MSDPLQSVLHPAGADADIIGQFAWVLFGAGALIFVAVMALLALSLRRHARPLRTRPVDRRRRHRLAGRAAERLLGWSTWRSAGLAPQVPAAP
jgi:cytochrome c oxidase subunit 2